ncbi:MAG: DJ-1/PfpI family protein [Calditrichae bacterium]|nr:DJ-1/PfpI family protein [Calditrichota bacterium]MCB0311644.1 DJ-1/PfpI family protein [Calditrichota bacterium]MCB9087652.1 DJ-1/PfpI family protein [Calditrichia bacterium]
MKKFMLLIQTILLTLLMGFAAWYSNFDDKTSLGSSLKDAGGSHIINAGFVCLDKVYNSELMAPYDILQHTVYRDPKNYVNCFIVTPDGEPFTSSEGITIIPHYSFDNAPPIDILIIPSTENSMEIDLKNRRYMEWLGQTIPSADYVMSLCDGAFPLAAGGALNGRTATTFPGDRDAFKKMFPEIDVRYDVNFVVDGKYITAVGGALSYEPALYLVEKLYSRENAERTAQGLVIDWDLANIPHLVVGKATARQ